MLYYSSHIHGVNNQKQDQNWQQTMYEQEAVKMQENSISQFSAE
jgi:hypothetical protein